MSRPDPTLLDPSRYPFACEIQPRFGDLDLNQHLNNVALAGIYEEARVRFHAASGYDRALAGVTAMAANVSIDYLGEGQYPDPLTVHVAVIAIGRTSHTVGQIAAQNGRLIGFARTVLVCVEGHTPAENPPIFVETLKSWILRP